MPSKLYLTIYTHLQATDWTPEGGATNIYVFLNSKPSISSSIMVLAFHSNTSIVSKKYLGIITDEIAITPAL